MKIYPHIEGGGDDLKNIQNGSCLHQGSPFNVPQINHFDAKKIIFNERRVV